MTAPVPVLYQMARFAGVGAIGTAAHYGVLIALVELFGADPLLATILGFAVGAVINYALARRFVFASHKRHGVALPRFLTIAAVGAVLNGVIFDALFAGAGLHYLLAQVIATGIVFLWGYVANRYWTFAGKGV